MCRQLRVGQAAIELDRVHARDAEDGVDAVGLEDLDQNLAAGLHRLAPPGLPQRAAITAISTLNSLPASGAWTQALAGGLALSTHSS